MWARNKFVAKLASDINKPDGMAIYGSQGLAEALSPLGVERMWGVGPVLQSRFRASGIRTFGDLQRWSAPQLATAFGDATARFHDLAHGRDERPVETDQRAKSIGHEQTFQSDLTDREEVESILLRHVERVATRLRRTSRTARHVVVKIRDGEFNTQTRSATLEEPTNLTDVLWSKAVGIFRSWAAKEFRPIRLIGFHAGRFEEAEASLFMDPGDERSRRLDEATDLIKNRFGDDAIARTASAFPPEGSISRSEGANRES